MGRHLYAHAVPALARLTVPVSSLERALPFYENVLRMTRLFVNHESAVLQGDGFELHLLRSSPQPSETSVSASFRVADIDEAIVVAIGAGAQVVDVPDEQPWGERQVVLRDPDGHRVCLVAPLA